MSNTGTPVEFDEPDKELMLQSAFAPFDARAWARFREFDPEAAEWLQRAVEAGCTPQEVRKYGQDGGYSEVSVNWLTHAAAWLERQQSSSTLERTADKPVLTVELTGELTGKAPAGQVSRVPATRRPAR